MRRRTPTQCPFQTPYGRGAAVDRRDGLRSDGLRAAHRLLADGRQEVSSTQRSPDARAAEVRPVARPPRDRVAQLPSAQRRPGDSPEGLQDARAAAISPSARVARPPPPLSASASWPSCGFWSSPRSWAAARPCSTERTLRISGSLRLGVRLRRPAQCRRRSRPALGVNLRTRGTACVSLLANGRRAD